MAYSEDEPVSLPLIWVGGDALPVVKVNQILLQIDHVGDVFLTLGTATPPALIVDSPQDLERQVEGMGYLPIQTVARLSLSPHTMEELAKMLARGLEMQATRMTEGGSSDDVHDGAH